MHVHSCLLAEHLEALLVHHGNHFLGRGRQHCVLEVNHSVAQAVIPANVFVVDPDVKLDVVKVIDTVPGERFAVHRVAGVVLARRLLLAVALVESDSLLLQFKDDVRIGATHSVLVTQVHALIKRNRNDSHGECCSFELVLTSNGRGGLLDWTGAIL